MSRRVVRLVVTLLLLGGTASTAAAANCALPPVCSAEPFLGNASCCFGLYCDLDGDITLSGPDCVLDFGNHDVTITGKVQLGTGRLKLRAKSVVIANAVDGKGGPTGRGGTLEIETFVGTALDVRLQTNAAKIDLSGGAGGGTLLVDAKGGIALDKGEINADGSTSTAPGGVVELRSETGNIHAAIQVSASDGGDTAGGSPRVWLRAPGGAVTLDGAKLTAEAGSIDIAARDAVSGDQAARLYADRGGSVDVSGGVIALAGEVSARAGTVDLHATAGALALTRTSGAGLAVGASGDGETGAIDLLADGAGPAGSITIATAVEAPGGDVAARASGLLQVTRRLRVNGVMAGGDSTGAGQVSLESELLDVELTADVLANDSQLEGGVDVAAGHDVILNGSIEAKGSMGGPGGSITIVAGNAVRLAAGKNLDASGGESGGSVDVEAGGDVELAATSTVDASKSAGGTPGAGGAIELVAGAHGEPGSLTIAGNVLANTRSVDVPSAIALEGCTVAILPSGTVSSARSDSGGPASSNAVTARHAINVAGKLLADGGNLLTTVAPPPAGGTVTPPFAVTLLPACTKQLPTGCLVPCPTCGDGVEEYPETCDDGPVDRCTSECGPTCRKDPACDAALACAGVLCDTVGGCYFGPVPEGTPCDDGDACTTTDVCAAGSCMGTGALACDDGNACNGVETCAPAFGCQPGTPPACDDDNACTTDGCTPATGCQHVANAAPCDDGDVCTVDDSCGNGACQPGPPLACGPGEICEPPGGCQVRECQDAAECDDGDACNGTEACVANACVPGTAVVCTDGDVCNGVETCDPATGACVPGDPCDDGDACNGVESCTQETGCQAGPAPDCDDGDVCTTDGCDPATGCTHDGVADCCEDASDCTVNDVCDDVACVANACVRETSALCCLVPEDCTDGNPCTTDDVCNASQRCEYAPLTGPACGDACVAAVCDAGVCETGDPVVCDDGDVCTDDTCDPVAGCVFTPVPGCCETSADCADDDPCTTDACDVDLHTCSHVPDETCAACADDVDCDPLGRCGGVACEGGVCVGVPVLACDDGNACTVDSCPDANGCVHTLVRCDDGLACNGAESCAPTEGCRAGAVPDCDDGDLCTDDGCQEPAGCTHVRRVGVPGVVCVLDTMGALIAEAAPDAVTPKLRRKLGKLLGRVRGTLRAAEGASRAAKRAKLAKRAGKQLRALAKAIEKGRDRGIVPDLADVLRRAVDTAVTAVSKVG